MIRPQSIFFLIAVSLLLLGFLPSRSSGQEQPASKKANTGLSSETEVAEASDSQLVREDVAPNLNWMRGLSGDRVTSLSDAELVAKIRRAIESDQRELDSLTAELEDKNSPYVQCEVAFQKNDERYQALAKALEESETDSERVSVQAELDRLLPLRELARLRFDLAIERRQLIGQMVPILQVLITQAERLMDQALGQSKLKMSDEKVLGSESRSQDGPNTGRPVEQAVVNGDDQDPMASAELDEAETDVRLWQVRMRAIEAFVELLDARLSVVDQAVQLEQSLMDNSRKTVDNAEAMKALYHQLRQEALLAGATQDDLDEYEASVDEAIERAANALERSRNTADRLTRFTEARGIVLEALATRRQDAETARQELERAERQVALIINPFHPRNVFRWFLDHGPNILAILSGMVVAYLGVRFIGSRLLHLVARRGIRGTTEERHSRADTLVNSFRQVGSLAVILGGTLMILEEAGIPIVPLLGGAAVLGLAVAFGAQNLIQDFFQGFMILLENQYKLKDFVKIGEHAGLVEQITLRTTALRGLDGTLHFIPNGQIQAVSNLTHGWSRALIDVSIAYKEDPDRVMEVIRDVCRQVRDDPKFRSLILEDAEVLGIEDLADSAVVMRFFIKTRPLQQWAVRREILRRLKQRFDLEGIEIPFPHRSLYLRSADGGSLEHALGEKFAGRITAGDERG